MLYLQLLNLDLAPVIDTFITPDSTTALFS